MAFKEYGNYDGLGLAARVRSKQVSATELLDEALARMDRIDPQINAIVVKHEDYARKQIEKLRASLLLQCRKKLGHLTWRSSVAEWCIECPNVTAAQFAALIGRAEDPTVPYVCLHHLATVAAVAF